MQGHSITLVELNSSCWCYSITGGVDTTNLFDRAPPQTPGNLNVVGGSYGPSAGVYDTICRTYTVGGERGVLIVNPWLECRKGHPD